MRGKAGRVLWLTLGILLVGLPAQAQCTKDTDCKGDRVCEAGTCTSPAAAAPAPPATNAESPSAPPAPAEGAPSPAVTPAVGDATEGSSVPPVGSALEPAAPVVRDEPAAATAPAPADTPATRRRSKPALVGGIVMVSAAPIALLVALSARNAQQRCDDHLQQDYPGGVLPSSERYRVDDCDSYTLPTYLFGIGGAVLAAAGIPLIIYGAKSVPAQPASGQLQMLPWATREAGGLKLRLTL